MGYKTIRDLIRPAIPAVVMRVFRSTRSRLKFILTEILFGYFLLCNVNKRHRSFEKGSDAKDSIRKILKDHWVDHKTDLHPKDRSMSLIQLKGVEGMGTENTSFFINEIVRVFACKGTYLEVGTLHGYSLLSAALFNPSTRCIGIDNFSEFNPQCENKSILLKNLRKFKNPKNVEFHDNDYREAIKRLFSEESDLLIDVYFYDGEHSYENQAEGLRIILPHLSRRCVIFVDDVNWESVERANKEFVTEHPEFKSVFKIKTEENCSKTWWNGFEVLVREF